MIKVLHVVSSLSRCSGVMSFIMNYYKHLDKTKIQFDFIYFYDVEETYLSDIKKLGGNAYKICHPKNYFTFQKKLDEFFLNNKNKYNIIHCHPIYSSFLVAKKAKKYNIKRIIQHSHTTKFSNKKTSAFRNKLIMLLSKKIITDYTACSEDSLVIFPKKIIKNKKYIILNNGINIDDYKYSKKFREKIRKEFNISHDAILIGNVGRFSSEKNHDILIKIFSQLHKKNNNTQLLLVGSGILKSNIEKQVKELNLEKSVIFAGVRTDVNEILSALDIFILPSSFEGFGIAAIEAQASGLLTICSKGVPDAVIINNAVKMDVFGSDNIKKIVNYIIENIDYKRISNISSLYSSSYNLLNEITKLEQFYLSIARSE